ncbi:MAG TPA: plastocyanin/azurin family copper-binding protein [Gemmatimonadaceae bacterium]|nr:plastocyanin/azurin family copper-binding protein [Gemmatimonadaceae bacterium]
MRFRLVSALLIAAACGGGGGSDGGPTAPIIPSTPATPVATTSVSLQSNLFNPENIVVSPSAVVTFTNNDNIAHNVVFANQAIGSVGQWSSGDRTITMPATAGTYSYTCTIHAGMNGTVKVQ